MGNAFVAENPDYQEIDKRGEEVTREGIELKQKEDIDISKRSLGERRNRSISRIGSGNNNNNSSSSSSNVGIEVNGGDDDDEVLSLKKQKVKLEKIVKELNEKIKDLKKIENDKEQRYKTQLESLMNKQKIVKEEKKRSRRSEEEIEGENQSKKQKLESDTSISAAPNTVVQRSIGFSGFKSNIPNNLYTKTMKKKLMKIVQSDALKGGYQSDDSDHKEILSSKITHLIAPSNARTMKVLQAVLSHKWIMCPEWLLQCEIEKKWVDEQAWGFKRYENPIKSKRVYLSDSFKAIYQREPTLEQCKKLVEIGQGYIVDHVDEADFVLIGRQSPLIDTQHQQQATSQHNNHISQSNLNDSISIETSSRKNEDIVLAQRNSNAYFCDWATFIDVLFPPYLEVHLRKSAASFRKQQNQSS